MNKSLVSFVVCAMSVLAFADSPFPTKNEICVVSNIISEAEEVMEVKRIWLEQACKKMALDVCWKKALSSTWTPGMIFAPDKYDETELKRIDFVFGEANVRCPFDVLPICFTNKVNSTFKDERRREISLKYGIVNYSNFDFRTFDKTPDVSDAIYVFETDVWMANKSISVLKIWQKMMMDSYFNELKKYFRQNGKSFVSKNGVNPILPYIQRFVAALNAPKMNGINACFAEINRSDVVFDFDKLISDNEIEKLRESFLSGNINNRIYMDITKMKLLVALGIDGYNEMVREYNGE